MTESGNKKTLQYKNDGFDLSKTDSVENSLFHAVVDLEKLKIIGLYTNPNLVKAELDKLKNGAQIMTTVLSFPKADVDTPIAAEDYS